MSEYRGETLKRVKDDGISGNHFGEETGQEYWGSGIKKCGANAHYLKRSPILVQATFMQDSDALAFAKYLNPQTLTMHNQDVLDVYESSQK